MKVKLLKKLRKEAKKSVYLCKESNKYVLYADNAWIGIYNLSAKEEALHVLELRRTIHMRGRVVELSHARSKRLHY